MEADRDKQKSVTQILREAIDEICDHYCKYPGMYIGEQPSEDVDMLEDTMYTEICAKCPLMKL